MRIKGILLILLCCFFTAGELSADVEKKKRRKKKKKKGQQETAFHQGQIGFQAAGGFLLKTDYSSTDYPLFGTTEYDRGFPIYFRGEYGITDFLSAGLYFGMFKEKVTITDVTNPSNINGFDHSFKSIGLRAAYHQNIGLALLDPYAGFAVGITTVKVTPFGTENLITPMEKGPLGFSIYAGANVCFTPNIGVFVEGGYSRWLPMISAGVQFKFL
ncbi:MAG TPA: hypothetical protein VI731_12400 [Bacteroidia bacterium]|nr:hypothetical protein [Bacteroidia bacterium]